MLSAKTPLLVGLLVLIGAGAFLFTFGSLDQSIDMENTYSVDAVFDDATGLVVNSRVMLSGIPVGMISGIKLDGADRSKARITLAIRSDIVLHQGEVDAATGALRHAATAMRLQASLLGDYYIGLTPGLAGPPVAAGGVIPITIASSGLEAVIAQMEDSTKGIFPKLDKIVTDISSITGSLRENFGEEEGTQAIREIRDNVLVTTKEVAALSTEVRTFVNQRVIAQGDSVERIIQNVEALTATLKNTSTKASDQVDGILTNVDDMTAQLKGFVDDQTNAAAGDKPGTVAHTLHSIDRSVAELEGTLENTRSITTRIDSGEGTIGRLVTDDALIDSVEGVVDDIQDITSGLSSLQIKVELRSDYLFNSNGLKNYVNVSVMPRPDKFYYFQLVSDPVGSVTRSRVVTTSNDPDKPPVLVEDIVSRDEGTKFTAQFGKRWRFVSFRYGIMESSGGVGIDVDLLEDALRFKVDAFDFGKDDWPRLRVLAAYEFVRHFFVAAGIDNILNNASRDYFVSLGLNFYDDDLKALLPFLPSP
jgi:phospholipid/cholesterol/gamma-HCH transport system substrate-binding protein